MLLGMFKGRRLGKKYKYIKKKRERKKNSASNEMGSRIVIISFEQKNHMF